MFKTNQISQVLITSKLTIDVEIRVNTLNGIFSILIGNALGAGVKNQKSFVIPPED
jgi:hypothetical protein